MKYFNLLFLLLFTTNLFGYIGSVKKFSGEVFIEHAGKKVQVKRGSTFDKNDVITTSKKAKVQLVFKDKTIVSLSKNAIFSVSKYMYEDAESPEMEQNILRGVFETITGKIGKIAPAKFKIKTRTATIGIRGTTVVGSVTPTGDTLGCTSGAITVSSPFGDVEFSAGQYTQVSSGQAPTKPKKIDASFNDAVGNINDSTNDGSTASKNEKKSDDENKDSIQDGEGNDASDDTESEGVTALVSDTKSTTDDVSTTTTQADTTLNASTQATSEETTTSTVTDTTTKSTAVYTANLSGIQEVGEFGELSLAGSGAINIALSGNTFTLTTSASNTAILGDSAEVNTLLSKTASTFTYDGYDPSSSFSFPSSASSSIDYSNTYVDGTYSATVTGKYDVYIGSKGEFLVGKTDQSVGLVDNVNTPALQALFYAGVASDISTLDASKMYIYKDFQSFEIKTVNGGFDSSSFSSSPNEKVYLNGKLKTIGIGVPLKDASGGVNNEFYSAKSFNSFRVNDDGSITGKSISIDFINSARAVSEETANGKLYGSVYQGIGVDTTVTQYTGYGSELVSTASTQKAVHTLTLDTTEALNAKTGSITLGGYALYNGASSDLSLTINRDTGAISSTIGPSGSTISFSGDITNSTSNYINDDNFGVVVSSSSGITPAAVANSGFLVSRADNYDATNDAISENNNDYSSWGYWTASFNDGTTETFTPENSAWVAGEITSATDMAAFITNSSDLSSINYKGNILGYVTTGSSHNQINLDSANQIDLSFNSSITTVSGSLSFKTSAKTFTFTSLSGTVSGSTFSFDTSSETTAGILSGNGSFFGPNGESVGGTLIGSGNDSVYAVFKALKQ
ncbi:FecR domain-containing protein [Sulfurimonas sp. SAG-AH-194-I05]|nr:transferrin-binding protein-like solute binding protein [Sulfurimonas sp. SAG-AH-194-I05]MDF1874280.1 FecR domain-containing protein [Sulfurimonas sp. SAG-AH-194-I05]